MNYKNLYLAYEYGPFRWAEKDVDPAKFSRELMRKASSLVEDEEVFILSHSYSK